MALDEHDLSPWTPRPESRFFDPTDRCPRPDRWTSTDADSTELEVGELVAALVRVIQPDVVVETGTAFGITTQKIVEAIRRNGHGFLYTLETNPERVAYVRSHGPAEDADVWSLVEGSSLDWEPRLDEEIGLLFCDTARDQRVDEILHWRSWFRVGTIVAVHDSAWDMGPLRGWLENSLVKTGIARAIDLPTPRGLTLLEILEAEA